MKPILNLNVENGPALYLVYAVAALLVVLLLWRRPFARRRLAIAAAGIAGGLIVGIAVVFVVQDWLDVFNSPLSITSRVWALSAFAAAGLAATNLWRSRVRRKILAAVAVLWFALTAVLGINAGFGLDDTIGDLLGISTASPIALPPLIDQPDAVPVSEHWDPPADLPRSATGSIRVPATESGFPARDAMVWLPPAARVPNPPRLPVVVMMMGQPGSPDVGLIGQVLGDLAAQNHGLAPIVVSVDQLGGSAYNNPLCIDGYQGNARTYLSVDVPDFIRSHFNVLEEPRYWTVAGFSNGGICALTLGALHPELFGNIVDVSGELQPDLGSVDATVEVGFGGDQTAYEAAKPVNLLRAGSFPDSVALFASGSEDEPYLSASRTLEAAAAKAGMTTDLFVSQGTGHGGATLRYGLDRAFEVLYPRLGLSFG
jgi:enterochelin esterase-like enzyme